MKLVREFFKRIIKTQIEMMKNQIITTLLLVLGFVTFNGQGFKAYNDIVNQSESAIITKDFEKALLSYNELKKQDYLYSRDIYNALICANKTKNWQEVNNWAKRFMMKGSEKRFFEQSKFKEYRSTPFWKELTQQKIKNSINAELVKSLDSLHSTDQERFVKLKSNPNTTVYDLTEEIDKKLFALEKKYGKINEESTGINIENDTIYRFLSKHMVLYRHSYQSHKPNSYFNEKLKNNELDKILYHVSIVHNLHPIVEYQNKLYYVKQDVLSSDLREDILNLQKITRVAYKNKDFADFSLYFPISKISSFADQKSEENFKALLNDLYTQ